MIAKKAEFIRSIAFSDGISLHAVALRGTKLRDGLSQNFGTALKLIDRHKLPRAMRLANVAGADHDRLTAERLHLRGFSAERDCGRLVTRGVFEQLDQR